VVAPVSTAAPSERRLQKLEESERELERRLAELNGSDRRRYSVRDSPSRRDFYNSPSSYRRRDNEDRARESTRRRAMSESLMSIDEIWDHGNPVTVQGGSLRTWSYANPAVKRVHVLLKTDGRPLDADVELWSGPDNTPHKMRVYLEDGGHRTFSTFIDTPRAPNTVAIKNTGHLEFPLYACVGPDGAAGDACFDATREGRAETIQGGALRTYPFDPTVGSVAVLLETDGRPLNARLELLQGPNNNKQVLEIYSEDGTSRPFMAVIQTPGSGNVVRIVNTAPVEFPMYAHVVPFEYNGEEAYYMDGIQPMQAHGGGGRTWY
jgi:hypothetical protein